MIKRTCACPRGRSTRRFSTSSCIEEGLRTGNYPVVAGLLFRVIYTPIINGESNGKQNGNWDYVGLLFNLKFEKALSGGLAAALWCMWIRGFYRNMFMCTWAVTNPARRLVLSWNLFWQSFHICVEKGAEAAL